MQDRVPLYPGRVKMTPVAGQANTFDFVRADDPTQVGAPLTKATFLKDATAALFGLTAAAVPDDVLAWIGKYAQYWWRRRAKTVVEVKEDITGTVALTQDSTDYARFYYSKTVSVDSTGKVSLNSPTTLYGVASSSSDASSLANDLKPYLDNTPYYVSSKNVDGKVYYVPPGSVIKYSAGNASNFTFGLYREGSKTFYMMLSDNSFEDVKVPAQLVNSSTQLGDWQYVQSSNRNAYPDSGTQDGYEYEYLGIPFGNAVIAPKIETGSYVGTGMCGQANPNTLTFGLVPKFVWIWPKSSIYGSTVVFAGRFYVTFGRWGYYGETTDVLINLETMSMSGNTLTWWHPDSTEPTYQLNVSGMDYYYLAIG